MPVETTNIVLVIAGGLIAGLLWINHRQSISLRDQLPPAFTPFIPVIINTLKDLASRTDTTLDDEIVSGLDELIGEKVAEAVAKQTAQRQQG